jgi:hypothetical protein
MILTRMGVIAASKPAVVSNVDITLYSSQDLTNSEPGYTIYYSTALCSGWDFWPGGPDCPISDTCAQYGTSLGISQNTTVYIAVKDCLGNFISYGGVDGDSACPSNVADYCYDYDSCTGTAFSFNSGTTNKDVAIGVYVTKLGYVVCT